MPSRVWLFLVVPFFLLPPFSAWAQQGPTSDKPHIIEALVSALETSPGGGRVRWRSPSSGNYGVIIPSDFVDSAGQRCRRYTRTRVVRASGQLEKVEGMACREPDGWWTVRQETSPSGTAVLLTPSPKTPREARRSDFAAEAQRLLNELGYAAGPVDGLLGPKTRSAIRTFQSDADLPVDGEVSDELLRHLRSKLASAVPKLPATEPETELREVEGEATPPSPLEAGAVARPAAARQTGKQEIIKVLDDLAYAVAHKIDADVETVARALWVAHQLEKADSRDFKREEETQKSFLSLLTIVEEASKKIGSAKDPNEVAAKLNAAGSPLELSSMLCSLIPTLRVPRARTMLEVAGLYSAEVDYLIAVRMYLLGFADLDSPVGMPRQPSDIAQPAETWLWGAEAIKQSLRQQLADLSQDLAGRDLAREVEIDSILARLEEVADRVTESKDGNVALDAAAPGGAESLSPVKLVIGGIGALEQILVEVRKFSQRDMDLVLPITVMSQLMNGHHALTWEVGYRSREGQDLGRVQRQVVTAVPLSLRPLSKQYITKANTVPRELAHEMLLSLPVELANLARLVDETVAYVRMATGAPPITDQLAGVLGEQPAFESPAVSPTTPAIELPAPVLGPPDVSQPTKKAGQASEEPMVTAAGRPEGSSEEGLGSGPANQGEGGGTAVAAKTEQEGAGVFRPAEEGRADTLFAEVGLKDGSVVAAKLVSGTLVYKSVFGQLEIAVGNVALLTEDGLKLRDGTFLKGKLVGGEVVIETQFGQHRLLAADIISIVLVDATSAKAEGS